MTVDLEKRTKTAQISLIKTLQDAADAGTDLGLVEAQVVLVADYSESMEWPGAKRYTKGEVQELAERLLALSLAGLDDDGNIQIVFFDHQVYKPITVDASNYATAVENWRTITPGRPAIPATPGTGMFKRGTPAIPGQPPVYRKMGGTNYLAAIKQVIQLVQEDLRQDIPTFVLFITDGQTSNQDAIKRELVDASKLPIFWQFLGLGYEPAFLKELDTMSGRAVDNVGLTTVQSTADMTDDEFFPVVTTEFLRKWLPAARSAGIVR